MVLATSATSIRAVEHEGFDEFSADEWFGKRARGTTTWSLPDGNVTRDGDFNVTMDSSSR